MWLDIESFSHFLKSKACVAHNEAAILNSKSNQKHTACIELYNNLHNFSKRLYFLHTGCHDQINQPLHSRMLCV